VSQVASQLLTLFAGLDRAHGRFVLKGSPDNGKIIGKASTELSPPTEELWQQHMDGTQGLGITPAGGDASRSI